MSKKTISLVCATAAIGAFGMSAGTASAAVSVPSLSSFCSQAPAKLRPTCNSVASKLQPAVNSAVAKVNSKPTGSLNIGSLLSGINLGSLTSLLSGANLGSLTSLLSGLKLG